MSDGLVLTQDGVSAVQRTLRERGLDAWLLYEFRQSNPISASLLSLPWTTRRGFALIPAEGEPVALIHAIERVQWQHWPWRTLSYSGWRELEEQLGTLLSGRGRVAMEISSRSAVPTLDRVPMGIVELVRETGVELASSGDLVSLFYARWSDDQKDLHYEAARVLPEVAKEAFQKAAPCDRGGRAPQGGRARELDSAALRRVGRGDRPELYRGHWSTGLRPTLRPGRGRGVDRARSGVADRPLGQARPRCRTCGPDLDGLHGLASARGRAEGVADRT